MGVRGSKVIFLAGSALALYLVSAFPAGADPQDQAFNKGVAAFDRGDFLAAYETWLPLADGGDLAAQRNVAHLLRKGLGVEKDPARAFYYYKASADAGLASAQVNLAALYEQGLGTPQSDQNAAYYYARAAKAGHANGQYHLALMAKEGRGMARDEALAHSLFKAAALQGHSGAREALQQVEARERPIKVGHGAPGSSVPPQKLIKTETEITLPLTPNMRSQMSPSQTVRFESALEDFARGERGEALETLRRLSGEGVAEASLRAGKAYLYGAGAPQNLASAFAFFQIADASEQPTARQMMKKTLMEMQRQALDQMDSD
ncbi:MAG: sel1 repeat family protein [Alphaproteobacteria bacterium]|nr:MAG: sel1 repeat family protein [Alphaproteobacteria bacterium]